MGAENSSRKQAHLEPISPIISSGATYHFLRRSESVVSNSLARTVELTQNQGLLTEMIGFGLLIRGPFCDRRSHTKYGTPPNESGVTNIKQLLDLLDFNFAVLLIAPGP